MPIQKATNILKNNNLSFTTILTSVIVNIKNKGALGLYTYLASKPTEWTICKQELQNHFNVGREAINTDFSYLKEIGAITIEPVRDTQGCILSWVTTLNCELHPPSTKVSENTSLQVHDNLQQIATTSQQKNDLDESLSRIRVSQNVVQPESGKSAPINKRKLQIRESIKIKEREVSKEETSVVSICTHDEVVKVFGYWQKIMNHPRAKLDSARIKSIQEALKLYTVEELQQAIFGCSRNKWLMDKKHYRIDQIFKDADHIEQFISNTMSTNNKKPYKTINYSNKEI